MFIGFSRAARKTKIRLRMGIRVTKKNWFFVAILALFYYSFVLTFYMMLLFGWLIYAMIYGIVALIRRIVRKSKPKQKQEVPTTISVQDAPSETERTAAPVPVTSTLIAQCDTDFEEIRMEYKKDVIAFRKNRSYIVYDLETTGLNPRYDEIIEIAMLKITDGVETDRFSTFVKPSRHIPAAATKVNGITDADVADAPSFSEIADRVVEFIGTGYPLVGHNIGDFDNLFLFVALGKRGLTLSYIDTLPTARRALLDLPNHKLITLIRHYGLDSQQSHRSMEDVIYNQIIFEQLCDEIMLKKRRTSAEMRAESNESESFDEEI